MLAADADREIEGVIGPVRVRALDRALAKSTDVTRYQLIGRRLYRIPRARRNEKRWLEGAEQAFETMLSRLLSLVPRGIDVPSFQFAVNLGDYPVRGAPIFTTWSRVGDGNARLPSSVHWEADARVTLRDDTVRAHRHFEADALARPWAAREPRAVWRGSATGMYDRTFRYARLEGLLGIPPGRGVARLDLCRIASAHKELIDARITRWPQVSESVRRRLEIHYPTAPWVSRSWFLEHQYVVNVDGNVATSSFLTFVGSGSVVLKQDSPYRDWCGHHILPGQHYLPVASDLSDLVAVARAATGDPAAGSEIAERGRAFTKRHLTGTCVDFYTISLLERYAQRAPRCSAPAPTSVPV